MSRLDATTVYRIFNADGELLYVGCSANGFVRLDEHRGSKDWWQESATVALTHYERYGAAWQAEQRAIKSESPKYNQAPHKEMYARGWATRRRNNEARARLAAAEVAS